MNLNQILSQIASQGIRLSAEGEQLKIQSPKGKLTPEIREIISQNKAELLKLLQNVSTTDSADALSEPLKPYQETSPYPPLSLNEQSLWFVWHLAPESYAYNVSFAGRMPEARNISVWQEVFEHLLQRHPSLRTYFPSSNNKPYRKIIETPVLDFQVIDASSWNVAEVRQKLIAAHQEPFDLENGPLVRVRFFQQAAQGLTFIVSAHHIICDGWSLNIMVEELPVLYHQLQTQESISLAPLSHSYPTFVRWQQEQLDSARGKQLWDYWQQKLEGNLPVLQLPTDYPRPSIQTYNGNACAFRFSPERTQQLKKLADRRKVSLYALLLTAYQVLLYRYTLQEDIIVGSPVMGRSRSEFNGIMGHFVNVLPMRSKIQGTASFTELLTQVQPTVLEALDYQDFPFALMVERLHLQRDLSYPPIMQTNFIFQKFGQIDVLLASAEENTKNWGGLNFIPYSPVLFEGQSDLDLEMSEIGSVLQGVFKYNTDLFKQSTIERIIGHFQTLLEGIVANPQQPVSHLPLLTAAERQQILVDWNDTVTEYPKDKCIHQLFEEQVEKTPNTVAVVFEDQQLTYEELNQKANQLAHYLQTLGVEPEGMVGICLERSIEMIVGLLGILKAGGAYVPLDPNYPQERLSYMLADSGVGVLLTQESLLESLPQNQAQVVCLDRDWGAIAKESKDNPNYGVKSDNLAYVIYTSGSTGQPKGVIIQHNNVLALLHGFEQIARKKEVSNSTSVCSYSFDVAVWEFFSSLCFGGTLHILTSDTLINPKDFTQLLIERDITTTYIPPALLPDAIAECKKQNKPIKLNRILVGVEPIKQGVLQDFRNMSPEMRIVNGYGPTETTICATFYNFLEAIDEEKVTPIGTPVKNYQIYILDRHLQPVPIGIPGELYIGGDGLARGYFNRPELTQEKFISNPFDQSKLYKTGDLARYLSDGNIELIGRIDNQVKIRGFRIELGEVESVLNTHPHIQQAVVIAREDIANTKRLLAYIVIDGEEAISTSQLRQFMKSKLPEYMIPSAFIILDTLPLTPNGKVNRRALPEPDETITREQEYVAPRTPVEETIANIFSDVLGVKNVGTSDNFFELGGHSLLAGQLISQLTVALEVEIPFSCVFESPTVAQLAETITPLHKTSSGLSLNQILSQIASQGIRLSAEGEQLKIQAPKGTLTPEIRELITQNKAELLKLLQNVSTTESSDALSETLKPYQETSPYPPLSLNEQSLWFVWHLAPESYAYNVSFAGRMPEARNISVWQEVFEHLLQRHPGLRTYFPSSNNKPYRKIIETPVLDFQVIDASSWNVAEVRQKLIAAHREPFDLENGPLMRVRFFQQAAQGLTFIVSAHHIICDGWSLNIMVEELPVLYHQLQTQESISLAPLSHSYPTFVHWQQELLESAQGKQLWEYWQQKLEGNLPVLQLPTDYPRPSIQTYNGDSCAFSLSPELTQKLKKLADSNKVSLYALLLTAYQVLLYRYTLQEDIIVGSPVTGRSRSEFNGIMGHFVNVLPMRSNIQGTASFTELLTQVQPTVLEALDYQDFPFALMVERSHLQRDSSYPPIMQTNFIFQKFGQIDVLLASAEETPKNWGELSFIPYSPVLFEGQSDLDLEMSEIGSLLQGVFKYNTDLFKQSTIERIVGHFQTLLEGIVANPQQPVSHLPLLTAAERQQILVDWNDTAMDYPNDKCIHQLFEEQVENNPNAIAVVFEDQTLTYSELNSKADRLAHYLQKLGVGLEVLVGISTEPSVEMVVGLLAILKAGGAYVPLDPAYPQERLQYMFDDSEVSVLLTQEKLLAQLPQHQAKVVVLDTDWENIATETPEKVNSRVSPKNLAYAIYTSGSTGKPKGVLVEHKGLCNLANVQMQAFQVNSSSRVVQFASLSFDASIWEIVMALGSGAGLYMGNRNTLMPGAVLSQWLQENKITHITIPPSALAAMPKEELPTLKTIIVAGEACPPELISQWSVGRQFVNAYGPSESTVCATMAECSPEFPIPPIGRPIANTQIYILDKNLQPLPIGVPGEIYIGGISLARGYLNREDLTDRRFIPNPFENSSIESQSSKLYKTGDLAQYLSDGNIEFIGRIDNQVKIRGFRIELGEIESVLNAHPQIQQAVVIAKEDLANTKRLLAYIVIDGNESIPTSQLRKFIKSKLPEYMIPSAFITLDTLPLTPNGKVNRKALPEPDEAIAREQEYIAPRTPIEETIANIFSEVLGVPNVGISDNFFELGGHSLLAGQVISKLTVALEVEIPFSCVFESPTVAQLAETITQLHNRVKTPTQQQQTQVDTTGSTHSLMEETFLEFKGNQIALCSWGSPDNPIVLCIHGLLDQGLAWQEVALPIVEQGYRVVAPDLFGHGRSSNLELVTAYSPLTFLAQIDRVIQQLPEEPFVLVGHSLGAMLAAAIASVRPEKIKALILVELTLPSENPQQETVVERLKTCLDYVNSTAQHPLFPDVATAASQLRQATPSLSEEFSYILAQRTTEPYQDGVRWSWDAILRTRSILNFNSFRGWRSPYLEILKSIQAPTTLVYGDNSRLNSPEDLQQQKMTMTQAKRVFLPGGHNIHIDAASALASLIFTSQ